MTTKRIISEEIKDEVVRLYLGKVKVREINKQTGVSVMTIYKILNEREVDRKSEKIALEDTPEAIKAWLDEHWTWTGKVIQGPKSKYRKVKKGEKGKLITPYRPDRIFR